MALGKKLTPLDFEKPIFEMEAKIEELEELSRSTKMNLNGEVRPLRNKLDELIGEIFDGLTPWQRVQIARHPARPFTSDYVDMIVDDFMELHGDRNFRDDRAILTGLGRIDGRKVLIVGHRKGRDTKEKLACNFGCAHPEGYKKAWRKMKLAEKFGLPIIALINTPGAYPGIGAEERGQAWAIAENLILMAGLRVPIISVVIGEGGSGGALGIGVGDRVFMLEHAYYSVISPEGCAAILWNSATKAPEAAEALKITSQDLLKLGVVDEVIPEPLGAAHRRPAAMAEAIKAILIRELDALATKSPEELVDSRYEKFRKIGSLFGDAPAVMSEVEGGEPPPA
ncbi:MAG: acetyl-CoA carboxylase carboxyltransferase subunit alpha [Planctomycetota bacterium]